MNIGLCVRIVGLLLMLFSLGTLPSMTLGWLQEDGTAAVFGQAFAATATSGVVLWLATQRVKSELQIRDGFMVTALFWIVLGIYGSLPFLLSDAVEISVLDAIFESVSGLTTTGATILVGLDHIPQSILFYRQLLQWLGGIGIIVLAVAVLPMLGIGGVQLYRAESTGPAKDSKLTPRITSQLADHGTRPITARHSLIWDSRCVSLRLHAINAFWISTAAAARRACFAMSPSLRARAAVSSADRLRSTSAAAIAP